jgi:hypothetical protein
MAIYLALAIIGAVGPWYFNVKYVRGLDGHFNPIDFFGEGFVNPASSSLTFDHLIVAATALVWMTAEAGRLGMARLWFFVLVSLLVAVSCGLPLFLLARERTLAGVCRRQVVPPGGLPPDAARPVLRPE